MKVLLENFKKFYLYLINKFYKSRNLNFDVLSSFFILQIITAVSIVSYTYIKNSSTIVDFSDRIVESISSSEVSLISTSLNAAMHSTELGSFLVRDPSTINEKNKDLIQFMIGHIKQFKFAEAIFICTESNYFILIMRTKKDATYVQNSEKPLPKKVEFLVRVIDGTTFTPTETWHYLNGNGDKLDEELIPSSQINFVPKSRSWYQKTKQMNANIWSDVYIGNPGKNTLVACGVPLFLQDGTFAGVIATSINLSQLSAEPFFNSGISMIINNKNEIIAHPNGDNLGKNIDGEVKLLTINEIKDKVVTSAFQEIMKDEKKERFIFEHDDSTYIALLKSIKNEGLANNWKFLMITPIDNFIGGVKVTQRNSLLICFTILLLSVVIIALFSKRISVPIHYLSQQADRITNFDLGDAKEVTSGIQEIQKLQSSITRMRKSLASFAKFVPNNLVKKLLDKGIEVKIGGTKKTVTIFFSSISNFNSLIDELSADKMIGQLSEYFTEMTEIINQHNGTVDKYISDEVMAFWGAPVHNQNHALQCCVSALLNQRRLLDLNRKWNFENKPSLLVKIGIHTGEVIVGNIGSSERMNYTILGDSVNLTARFVGVNNIYGTNIIISESTLHALNDHAVVRPLDIITVKGKIESVPIYELIAIKNTDPLVLPTQNQIKFCDEFTKGFRYYLERRWGEAIDIFNNLQLTFGKDEPCDLYVQRCKEFQQNPPPTNWDGVYHMKTK